MATPKNLAVLAAQGLAIYVMVRRDADGYFLNDASGAFVTPAPADPYLALTEHATLRGLYEVAESRTAWTAGDYTMIAYSRLGGSPAPATDTVLDLQRLAIDNDQVVTPATAMQVANFSKAAAGRAMTALGALLQSAAADSELLRLLTTALERNGLRP